MNVDKNKSRKPTAKQGPSDDTCLWVAASAATFSNGKDGASVPETYQRTFGDLTQDIQFVNALNFPGTGPQHLIYIVLALIRVNPCASVVPTP
jgi:hypothetical protein